MSRPKEFVLAENYAENLTVALFGKFARDQLARRIFVLVTFWKGEGVQAARRIEFDAKQKANLLEILVPALDKRDSTPFRLFAEAVDALNSAKFPDKPIHFH